MWTLIDNDKHELLEFTSKAKLREYAKQHGLKIRKSPTSERCYYTDACGYVPGNH